MTTSPGARRSADVSAEAIPGPRPRPVIGNALDIGRKGAVEAIAPVRSAFLNVFREQTGKPQADADAWLTGLRADHRYLEDIWGGSAAPAEPTRNDSIGADVPPAPAVPREGT
jgi:hypothetical protein